VERGDKVIRLWSSSRANKKLFLPALTCLALFFIISNLNDSFALQYSNYTSDKYQIQFQFPSDWLIKEKTNRFDEGADIDISNVDPQKGMIQISLSTGLFAIFGTSDIQSAVKGLYEGITGSQYAYDIRTIELPSFLNIDGQRTGTFLVTVKQKYEASPVTLAVQTWLTFLGDNGYEIKYMSIPEHFDNADNLEIRDRLINSVHFLGQSNSTNSIPAKRFAQ